MPSATVPKMASPSAILEVPPHTTPQLQHTLNHDSSVLALVVGNDSVYAGTQNGEILVWLLGTFEKVHHIQAHKRSVMSLFLSNDGTLLFSSASDPIVNVWCPRTMARLYEIYSTNDSFGDIFSVSYSSQFETVYYGAQNTSIQWVNLQDADRRSSHDSPNHPDRRNHRFFDSRAVGGSSTPRPTDERYELIPRPQNVLETDKRANKMFAHYGYIYCMLMAKSATASTGPEEDVLISGGGDGTIKVWKLGGRDIGQDGYENGIVEIMVLGEDDAMSVMSLAVDGSFLYSGKLDGIIELWDLDTKQKLRAIKAHKGDVMTLQMGWGYLWSASRTGTACKHNTVHYGEYQRDSSQNVSQKYQCLTQWKAHDGKVLSSAVTTHDGNQLYITGANDNNIAVWVLENEAAVELPSLDGHEEDMMITSLREFVSFKTISSRPEYAEDCRRGASFLRTLFKRLGGDVEMLSGDDTRHHPVVLAKFCGKLEPATERKKVLFYGHYDVVPADTKNGKWSNDPFQLTGTNGYLYGRGVSDNKGPIMAALYAVNDLMQAKSLDSDIVFLIEGQEESGSRGFKETVRKYKDLIGDIDYILLANSYWLNDDTPCLTYGLRGVMHATVCVESSNPDLHSGVDGSYMVNEPLSDLMVLLSKLKGPRNRIMLPGFYDGILPLTAEEEARYDDILSVLTEQNRGGASAETVKANLMARWREPNLTHHKVKVSGPDGSLISSHANAKISVRLVPGQEVEEVTASLTSFLEKEFSNLESDNKLTIRIDNQAEPWLGDPSNYIFRTLEEALIQAWAPLFSNDADGNDSNGAGAAKGAQTNGYSSKVRKPLYIREGGSIPAIRFLEKEFNAPAAHLPCGQSSDAAHLDNERLRVVNLLKSREILSYVFKKL
ncbi:glutathione degradosome [Durotheca rogersii]|uniref:glutathione degradosome n=1 Tax=Durotheca rogersii TaxID=419775 RepID=UPI00221E8F9B|nr:glutathione degradosome [Durotheca rogersii]KAI5866075.1 glutathione degradosome [Durotheca rogersii]